jgi:hypothetical protein
LTTKRRARGSWSVVLLAASADLRVSLTLGTFSPLLGESGRIFLFSFPVLGQLAHHTRGKWDECVVCESWKAPRWGVRGWKDLLPEVVIDFFFWRSFGPPTTVRPCHLCPASFPTLSRAPLKLTQQARFWKTQSRLFWLARHSDYSEAQRENNGSSKTKAMRLENLHSSHAE